MQGSFYSVFKFAHISGPIICEEADITSGDILMFLPLPCLRKKWEHKRGMSSCLFLKAVAQSRRLPGGNTSQPHKPLFHASAGVRWLSRLYVRLQALLIAKAPHSFLDYPQQFCLSPRGIESISSRYKVPPEASSKSPDGPGTCNPPLRC